MGIETIKNRDTERPDRDSKPPYIEPEDYRGQLYGDHETLVWEGQEADLHKSLVLCEKNPNHSNFIPVTSFNLKHLPEGHRDPDLYDFIRAMADLAVRVDVRTTSPHRPMFWPRSSLPYPFHDMRGKPKLRTGSGMVSMACRFADGFNEYDARHWKSYTACWCTSCQLSDSPSNVWWELEVYTAAHVVFDDTEARRASLKLFYDKEDSPAIVLDKMSVFNVDIERDRCLLKCVTCDEGLVDTLNTMHAYDVWWKVHSKYTETRDVHRLTFIVSHPHGCTKQISIGQWKGKYKVADESVTLLKFSYSTCTCPGSSGATVHCVGFRWWGFDQLVHSGTMSGLNFSGGWSSLGLVQSLFN